MYLCGNYVRSKFYHCNLFIYCVNIDFMCHFWSACIYVGLATGVLGYFRVQCGAVGCYGVLGIRGCVYIKGVKYNLGILVTTLSLKHIDISPSLFRDV